MSSILFIEDNKDELLLIEEVMLKYISDHKNTNFKIAHSFKEALCLIQEAYTLIVLDLNLIERSGLEILQEIRKKNKKVPIVMFTSSSAVSDIERSLLLGANSFVVKPLDFSKFINKLYNILCYWLTVHQH